jgi:hypothetical protein
LKKLVYIATLFFIYCKCHSQVLNSTGSWSPQVNASQVSEAGLDYPNTYAIQSSANQTLIDLQRGGSFLAAYWSSWRVDVRKVDFLWDSRLKLEIRRSGTGNGQGFFFAASISGGTNYQQLTNGNTQFFTGNGIFTGIPIQYRLSGFSVL